MLEAETTPITRCHTRNSGVNGTKAQTTVFPKAMAEAQSAGEREPDSQLPSSPASSADNGRQEPTIDHAVFEICYAAKAVEVHETSPISMFRQATAMDILSSHQTDNPDFAVGKAASRRAEDCAAWGAAEPAGTPGEVAAKLAYLVRQLASLRADDHARSVAEFTQSIILASCALSDLVLMAGRPIHLPAAIAGADAPPAGAPHCYSGNRKPA